MDGDITARLVYLAILVTAVGGYLLVEYRGRMGQMIRGLMSWALIIVGLTAGYGLWNDMSRQIIPRQAVATGGEVVLPKAADGHFYLTLTIDGTAVNFMVDTGASGVFLSQKDAARLGFKPKDMAFIGSAQTANGTVRTARIKLKNVVLGRYEDATLPAYVNDAEMFGSLLGMDYLGRFRIEIDTDQMVLRR
jgi:aspartyl protease family protein